VGVRGRVAVERLLSEVAGRAVWRHDLSTMARDHTRQTTSDLFSAAPSGTASPPATKPVQSARERHVLPQDLLPNAVKHLSDQELDLLISACLEEAKGRGKSLPRVQPDKSAPRALEHRDNSFRGRGVEVATVSLTRGQVNAVRAAFKAGIKPSLIARQFGISQSDVRKVLASDAVSRSRP
jgi:hypothetical protein